MVSPSGEYVYSPKLRQRSIVRKQISRYSSQTVGLNIKGIINGAESFIDPDPGTVSLQLYLEDNPDTETPPGNILATATDVSGLVHVSTGVYTYTLQPNQTIDSSLITALWSYKVQGTQFSYYDFYETVEPMPTYDSLSDSYKSVVEQTNWMIGDLYDSVDGGPHLIDEFQTKFGYERLAQILVIACNRLNYESQPLTKFTVLPQSTTGNALPDQWLGILQWGHYIEVLRHLARSYTEQIQIDGGPGVAYANRRDYATRWQTIISEEMPDYKHAVRIFKRKQLNLGSGAMLVSGGIFGRSSGIFRSSYSAQARSARFGPMSWVGVVPNHS